MANLLNYKGYQGSIDIDLEDSYLHGKILFIDDAIIYSGETIEELKQSFYDAVDGYISLCQEIGKEPQKAIYIPSV